MYACIIVIIITILSLCRIFIRYAIPAPTPLQDALKHFIIIGIIIITIVFTRDYDGNPLRDTILWHSRLKKKTECTLAV